MAYENRLTELLMDKSRTDIQDIINPHRNSPYPLSHIGHFAKFPKEVRFQTYGPNLSWISEDYKNLPGIVGWIYAGDLKVAVCKYLREIGDLSYEDFKAAANAALDEVANYEYGKEWDSVVELGFIKRIIGEQPAAKLANENHCTLLVPYLRERLNQGEAVLMDIGCGEGGSSLKIVESFSQEQRHTLVYLATDIMPDAVEIASKNLREMGVGKTVPIITVAAKIHESELMKYKGKVDGFVSGACIHHNTNFDTIFKTVNELMALNGQMRFWDWLHVGWTGQYVRPGYNIPETTEGLTGRGVEGVREIYKVWVGLYGFGVSEEEKAQGKTLGVYQEKLLQDFDRQIRTEGFEFHKWLEENLVGKTAPNGEGPYQSAEAHCDPFIYKHYLEKYFGKGSTLVEQMPGTSLLFGFSVDKK